MPDMLAVQRPCYPLIHSQSSHPHPHSQVKYPSSCSPALSGPGPICPVSVVTPMIPAMRAPSPTPSITQIVLRRYSPLCLHLQLNEHQKRKKEKRERRQERRNEKKRLAEHEMAMRLRMETEQPTATDESLVKQEMARIEQTQQSQRLTPTTTRPQQSLGAALASPQYTASLIMTLEKLSGAQKQQQQETITQQKQQPSSLPPSHSPYSPIATSSHKSAPCVYSPSSFPVSSCSIRSSSLRVSTPPSCGPVVCPPLNPCVISPHPSHPHFRPVISSDISISSPSQHQRQLLTQQPDHHSPSITTRFLLGQHGPSSHSAHDVDCVELMSCTIEDIPSDHVDNCDPLFSDFSTLCIRHDEYDEETTQDTPFHLPHSAEYVSFGTQCV